MPGHGKSPADGNHASIARQADECKRHRLCYTRASNHRADEYGGSLDNILPIKRNDLGAGRFALCHRHREYVGVQYHRSIFLFQNIPIYDRGTTYNTSCHIWICDDDIVAFNLWIAIQIIQLRKRPK